MSGRGVPPEPEGAPAADGRPVSVFRRFRDSAPLRTGLVILIELLIVPLSSTDDNRESFFHRLWRGCALLGFVLVFVIEIPVVLFFEDGDNLVTIEVVGFTNEVARLFDHFLGRADHLGYTFVDIDN